MALYLSLTRSPFLHTRLSPNRLSSVPSPSLFFPRLQNLNRNLIFTTVKPRTNKSCLLVVSAQSNFLKVVQTAWKIGKDGIEAGTNFVPESVPRPVARVSVAVVAFTVGLFLLKSFISTAFFVLAMMGFIYFAFIALNKEEGVSGDRGSDSSSSSKGGARPSTDEEALDEVRRIMKKYK